MYNKVAYLRGLRICCFGGVKNRGSFLTGVEVIFGCIKLLVKLPADSSAAFTLLSLRSPFLLKRDDPDKFDEFNIVTGKVEG